MVPKIPPDADAALDLLSGAEPTAFLTPSLDLSEAARAAVKGLFDCAAGIAASRVRVSDGHGLLKELHANGFDPEQIWLQLDLQSSPLISGLRRRINKSLKKLESGTPPEFFRVPELAAAAAAGNGAETRGLGKGQKTRGTKGPKNGTPRGASRLAEEDDDEEEFSGEPFSSEEDEDEGGDAEGRVQGSGEDEEEEEEEEKSGREKQPFEDRFLKMEDMERFLEEAEADEGEENEKGMPELYEAGDVLEEEEEDESDEGEDGDLEDGDVTAEDFFRKAALKTDDEDEIRYDDFFGPGGEPKNRPKKKATKEEDEDMEGEGEFDEDEDEAEEGEGEEEEEDEEDDEAGGGKKGGVLANGEQEMDPLQMSAHERRTAKLRKQAEELERANLNPKSWTMQGEVAAGKRPKNSALEVELDFEHAQRPAPVITEEVTASLEDIIKQRILEARFDDVERKKPPVTATPKERRELDDSKSQQGLAEIYEAEYAEAAGLAPAATSTTDAIKHQAALLFKELCGKLDALSHFHFAPKPVIEDMTVKADVPALAMEEVAPMAVSDASLLAPEEVFAGGAEGGGVRGSAAGQVRGEQELTPEERSRRHRKVKRKRKAELQSKHAAQKGGPEERAPKQQRGAQEAGATAPRTNYTKSAQVFAKLQETRDQPAEAGKKGGKERQAPLARTALKL